MKCIGCGKSPATDGITLHRQNAFGEVGVWACERCNKLPIDPEVKELVDVIRAATPSPSPEGGNAL